MKASSYGKSMARSAKATSRAVKSDPLGLRTQAMKDCNSTFKMPPLAEPAKQAFERGKRRQSMAEIAKADL